MNKDEMVAWLRAWAKEERSHVSQDNTVVDNVSHIWYAQGIEEAANEIEERLT